jgi:hypothetical protein
MQRRGFNVNDRPGTQTLSAAVRFVGSNGSQENVGLMNQEPCAREDAKARRKKKQTKVREIA